MCYSFFIYLTGGRLVYQYTGKPRSLPKCGDCKVKLHGVSNR